MFQLQQNGTVQYLTVTEFEKTGLVGHAFSTRKGGVSTGETATMNFGFNRKDTRENITENFRRLCGVIDADYTKLVVSNQVHKDIVYPVTEQDAGKGLCRESDIKGVDALITNVPGIPICTFHADCMPILLLDPVKRAIGAVHSGWKSTVLNIAAKTVWAMEQQYGSHADDLLCAIGPSIGPCHFEVDEDVAANFPPEFITIQEKPHVDLWGVAKQQLQKCGVPEKSIIRSDICTYCHKDLYYSYRGDQHRTGSMASIIMLK